MIEVITHPITLLCLGVIFIICALLFFYFKRSLMLIEQAQMEQANVLHSFISNFEIKMMRGGAGTGTVAYHTVGKQKNVENSHEAPEPNQNLNDVSDDELSEVVIGEDMDSDGSESTYEDSDDEIIDNNNEIKVINVEDLEELSQNFSGYKNKIVLKSHISDIDTSSCDDTFSSDEEVKGYLFRDAAALQKN